LNKFEGLRTIFLDRDGVINRKAPKGEFVWKWTDFHALPGLPEALARLNAAGLRVYVVTNQRGVSLGLYTEHDILALHQELSAWLAQRDAHIDAFYYCPHPRDSCNCRKPLGGMFEQAYREHGGDASTSVMIGDAWSDIEAGRRAGMRTIAIADTSAGHGADAVCGSLTQAVELILWTHP
jgi:D-glycero-D-manno-heptose 1,7-bisphosphate phosphatase